MAYSIRSINENVLDGSINNDNPNQLDFTCFTDFMQLAAPTNALSMSGGGFASTTGNGGTATFTSAAFAAYQGFISGSIKDGSGVVNFNTGSTSNSTGYISHGTSMNILPGIPTPGSGLITKYEAECGIVLQSIPDLIATTSGAYRFGFMNSNANTEPTDGIYLEFESDSASLPGDTTWNLVIRKDGTGERINTGVVVDETTETGLAYRLYLCVERDSSGTISITYKIKNRTFGVTETNTEVTTTASNTAYYPSASTDYMGVNLIVTKLTDVRASASVLYCDYIGCRIRRPLEREILIGV